MSPYPRLCRTQRTQHATSRCCDFSGRPRGVFPGISLTMAILQGQTTTQQCLQGIWGSASDRALLQPAAEGIPKVALGQGEG